MPPELIVTSVVPGGTGVAAWQPDDGPAAWDGSAEVVVPAPAGASARAPPFVATGAPEPASLVAHAPNAATARLSPTSAAAPRTRDTRRTTSGPDREAQQAALAAALEQDEPVAP